MNKEILEEAKEVQKKIDRLTDNDLSKALSLNKNDVMFISKELFKRLYFNYKDLSNLFEEKEKGVKPITEESKDKKIKLFTCPKCGENVGLLGWQPNIKKYTWQYRFNGCNDCWHKFDWT